MSCGEKELVEDIFAAMASVVFEAVLVEVQLQRVGFDDVVQVSEVCVGVELHDKAEVSAFCVFGCIRRIVGIGVGIVHGDSLQRTSFCDGGGVWVEGTLQHVVYSGGLDILDDNHFELTNVYWFLARLLWFDGAFSDKDEHFGLDRVAAGF